MLANVAGAACTEFVQSLICVGDRAAQVAQQKQEFPQGEVEQAGNAIGLWTHLAYKRPLVLPCDSLCFWLSPRGCALLQGGVPLLTHLSNIFSPQLTRPTRVLSVCCMSTCGVFWVVVGQT